MSLPGGIETFGKAVLRVHDPFGSLLSLPEIRPSRRTNQIIFSAVQSVRSMFDQQHRKSRLSLWLIGNLGWQGDTRRLAFPSLTSVPHWVKVWP